MSGGVQTGTVHNEGDDLYYEVRGAGPPLLMIHGGIIDASGFSRAADLLADAWSVITYDRRGYSRSSQRAPINFEISQQARDALAVLRTTGHDAARVFGTSGGAIIGLEMVRSHPDAVTALIAHEPPVIRVLPDAEAALEAFTRILLATWEEGPDAGMRQFSALNAVPRTEGDRAATTPDDLARIRENIPYFLRHEMLPFAMVEPDLRAIKANGVPVTLAMGEMSREPYHGRTVPILAERLGAPLVIFPGHHTSYQSLVEDWTAALRRVMGDG